MKRAVLILLILTCSIALMLFCYVMDQRAADTGLEGRWEAVLDTGSFKDTYNFNFHPDKTLTLCLSSDRNGEHLRSFGKGRWGYVPDTGYFKININSIKGSVSHVKSLVSRTPFKDKMIKISYPDDQGKIHTTRVAMKRVL